MKIINSFLLFSIRMEPWMQTFCPWMAGCVGGGHDGHSLWICLWEWFYLSFIQHLPKFPSLPLLLSNCIMVRWMLPFGLSAVVLNFFLRWINSIFHGGRSEYKCELAVTVVLDDEAMARVFVAVSSLFNFNRYK